MSSIENTNLFDSLNVEQNSSKSFHNFIRDSKKNNKIGLFIFYAPWCPHCKEKGPFLKALVNKFNTIINVHTYNCVLLAPHDKFCSEIKSYPTMFIVNKGKKYEVTDEVEILVALVSITNSMEPKEVIEEFRRNNFQIDNKKEIETISKLK